MPILVTGGAGYIGSHTVLSLLEKGYDVVVLDNHSNSSYESLRRIESLTGRNVIYYEGDVSDRLLLKKIFKDNKVKQIIHFAGLKSVSESVALPLKYYENNVMASIVLIEEMIANNIFELIFSSSATVYGNPVDIPLKEISKVGGTTNPYGTSKLMVEHILTDVAKSCPQMDITILRYFNPAGAHSSGLIGEDPNGIPCNLVPYISQVAVGKLSKVSVYGHDYPTHDGTGVRDYIHVMDLAEGHVAALQHKASRSNCRTYNLGTGKGYSVLDLIAAFERQSNTNIPYEFVERRAGDVAECWANPDLARQELKWFATRGLDEMMRDAWNWQQKNPDGYKI